MTILLTGASGVLGSALLTGLGGLDVLAAVHRRPVVAAGTRLVRIDVTRRRLGLSTVDYRRLCAEVDAVVHCAGPADAGAADGAVMDGGSSAPALLWSHVEGTTRIVELAADAGAPLVHVSTASVAGPGAYPATKRAAEDVVRASGVKATIVRPSVVIGDSRTGTIRRRQALLILAGAARSGRLPFVPARPGALLDLVPQDVVAAAVRGVLGSAVTGEELWLTAGPAALTIERALELTAEAGPVIGPDAGTGRAAGPVRLVDPSIVDRLIRPAFGDLVPERDLRRLDRLTAFCALALRPEPLPTSFGRFAGSPARRLRSIGRPSRRPGAQACAGWPERCPKWSPR